MRIAVVHGLLRGGAARRLDGTVDGLRHQPSIQLHAFALAGSVELAGVPSRFINWEPLAPRQPRWARPAWRYVDLVGVQAAWARVWEAVARWDADIVFANPCALPGGAPPGVGNSLVPVVYYCDEPRRVDYERDAANASNAATRLPYALMRRVHRHDERASVAAAHCLLTNSAYTAGRIRNAYGRDAAVIMPGIVAAFGRERRVAPMADRSHLLSVGTMIPSKGHDLVIRAAALARVDLPVVIVAPRAEKGEARRLTALAAELGIHIDLRVGITDEELVELYQTALATLYLAREEPLGLVSLEAQACGTPVIVADDGGLVETVSHGVSGFCISRTAEAAATALNSLEDRQLWSHLAHAAAERPVPRDADTAVRVLEVLRKAHADG